MTVSVTLTIKILFKENKFGNSIDLYKISGNLQILGNSSSLALTVNSYSSTQSFPYENHCECSKKLASSSLRVLQKARIKIVASVAKSLHQDCCKCYKKLASRSLRVLQKARIKIVARAIYTYQFFSFTYTLLFCSKIKSCCDHCIP